MRNLPNALMVMVNMRTGLLILIFFLIVGSTMSANACQTFRKDPKMFQDSLNLALERQGAGAAYVVAVSKEDDPDKLTYIIKLYFDGGSEVLYSLSVWNENCSRVDFKQLDPSKLDEAIKTLRLKRYFQR